MTQLNVSPRYGRDYRSKAEALAAWNGGKDFTINGPPAHAGLAVGNYDDLRAFTSVKIRFNRNTDFAIVELCDHERDPRLEE